MFYGSSLGSIMTTHEAVFREGQGKLNNMNQTYMRTLRWNQDSVELDQFFMN